MPTQSDAQKRFADLKTCFTAPSGGCLRVARGAGAYQIVSRCVDIRRPDHNGGIYRRCPRGWRERWRDRFLCRGGPGAFDVRPLSARRRGRRLEPPQTQGSSRLLKRSWRSSRLRAERFSLRSCAHRSQALCQLSASLSMGGCALGVLLSEASLRHCSQAHSIRKTGAHNPQAC